jgi:hypothetical protein|tara:strand:+ start:802 stop:1086 length:285 start_codon:yes stop_codon:yes gene_type:complete
MADTVFINGLYTYKGSKPYIVSKNSLNVEKFKQMLEDPTVQKHIKENEGFLKFVTMVSKNDKVYSKLEDNSYREVTSKQHSPDRNANDDDGLPF